jgi:predicted ATPase
LSDYSGTNFTEIYLEHEQIRVDPPNGTPYLLNNDDLAHGLIKMVPGYIAAEYFRPNYILWDDIETALHPKLLARVFEWLAEMDSQAIVSTHSMDALIAALDVPIDDLSIVQLSADEERKVSFDTFNKDQLKQIIGDAGHDPRFFPVDDT